MDRRIVVPVMACLLLAASTAHAQGSYRQIDLASDVPGLAPVLDPALIDPWGIAAGPPHLFWVVNNGTSSVQLLDDLGGRPHLTFAVPAQGPTGVVFNPKLESFAIRDSARRITLPALVIVAAQDGSISAWHPLLDSLAAVRVAFDPAASYTGLAMGTARDSAFLYGANFAEGKVEAYDGRFQEAALADSFADPALPPGYVPFNVANLGGELFVMYALSNGADEVPGPGLGYVNVFDTEGRLLRRFASSGVLNAPWGAALAPPNFGRFAGNVLISNFGDGHINAFDRTTGDFIASLSADSLAFPSDSLGVPRDSLGVPRDSLGGVLGDTLGPLQRRPLAIPGLWGIAFSDPAIGSISPGNIGGIGGPGGIGDILGGILPIFGEREKNARLAFAAGIQDETHGLFGSIRPALDIGAKTMPFGPDSLASIIRLVMTTIRASAGEQVRFQVAVPSRPIDLTIYDVAGRVVARPARGAVNASAVVWNGANADGTPAAAGLYFYRASAGGRAGQGKFVLLR